MQVKQLKKIYVILLVSIIGISISLTFATAASPTVKPTIPTTSKPVTTTVISPAGTTNVKYNDVNLAGSFSVSFVYSTGNKEYYFFPKIVELKDVGAYDSSSPSLQLQSIPSKDKKNLYDIVKKTLEKQYTGDFDILIESYAKDNTSINVVKYAGCKATDYWLYVNNDKNEYRLSKTDGSELREVFNFACSGYVINPTK